jgi:hypothetical protein
LDSSIRSEWLQHVNFAKWLVERVKPELVVDLGTFDGTSALALSSKKGKVVTIDKKENAEAIEKFKMVKTIEHRISTFDDEVNSFDDLSIDILHIDGDHSFKSVYQDCTLWSPKLKKNGVLLMHDVYNPCWIGPLHLFFANIIVPKVIFLLGNGLGVATNRIDVLEEIASKWPGEVVYGNTITEIYKTARAYIEWVKTALGSSAQGADQRDLREKIDSQLTVGPLP